MNLKESIYNSIKNMSNDELTLLHEQIRLLENMKAVSQQKKKNISLEKIHKMASSSKSNWSDSVIEDRIEKV